MDGRIDHEAPPTGTHAEIEQLRQRVSELEDTIAAIRSGEVDAIVVTNGSGRDQLYTLSGPDAPYQTFVDHMAEGALTVDSTGTILYSNSRLARMLGLPLELVVGSRFDEHLLFEHAGRFRALLATRTGSLESFLVQSDGNLLPIRCSSTSLGADDRTRWFVVTELGVQRHIAQLQSLIGVLIDAMAEPDIPGALRVLTQRACAIIGAHQGMTTAVQGADWSRAITAAHFSEKYAAFRLTTFAPTGRGLYRSVCEGNRPFRLNESELDAHPERDSLTAETGRAPMRGWLAAPLIAADGSNLGLAQFTDKLGGTFTEHDEVLVRHIAQMAASVVQTKRAEVALQQSDLRFRQLADTIPQLAWMARADGWIYWYNRRWYEYTGTTPEQMEGWGWERVHDPEQLPVVLERWQASIASGTPFDMEFPLRGADGVFRPFYTLVRPFRDESGAVVQWFGTNTDVSAQHRLVQDRNDLLEAERAARSEAERISRMKDEFVATLSHELRTPLNAILGWSYMIARGDVQGADLKRGLETIERNARAQVQMIEDLLDMSRIISGKLRLEIQEVDTSSISEAAIASIGPAAQAKGITLHRVDKGAQPVIRGDPHRLQQILWNLLSNAVKFTGNGGNVTIAVGCDDSSCEIRVSDDGIGIAPEFLPQVFERFRQADGSTTRSYSGLGLGLSIVKQLVELHGGTIEAASAGTGRGSTFTVRLPRIPADSRSTAPSARAAPPEKRAPSNILAGVKLLCVDDEPDARDVVARILTDHGATVMTAGSADEGRKRAIDFRPDLLISDLGMPLEDGFALIRSIRSSANEAARSLPAIALTALARAEDRDRAISAGFQAHISKPVQIPELISTVAKLVGR